MALVSLFYKITLSEDDAMTPKLFPVRVIVPVPLDALEVEIVVRFGLVMLSL